MGFTLFAHHIMLPVYQSHYHYISTIFPNDNSPSWTVNRRAG